MGNPSCVSAGGTARTNLKLAIDSANLTTAPDRIEIGAGTFAFPGAQPSGTVGHPVDVVGAGRDLTTITAGTATDTYALTLQGPDSSVSDLKIKVPAGATSTRGLSLADADAERVDIVVDPASATSGLALAISALSTDTNFRDSTITTPRTAGFSWYGVLGGSYTGNSLNFERSEVSATTAMALIAQTNAAVNIHGSVIDGGSTVIVANGDGAVTVDSSVLIADSTFSASVAFGIGAASGSDTLTGILRQSTVIGKGSGLRVGARAYTQTGMGVVSPVATTRVQNTEMRNLSRPLWRSRAIGTSMIYSTASNYDNSGNLDSNPGSGGLIVENEQTNFEPGFVDEAAGDYRLRWDSPLVDQGTATGFATALTDLPSPDEPQFDFFGEPRIAKGKVSTPGGRRDIGASEYQFTLPTVSAGVNSPSGTTDTTFRFSGSGSTPQFPIDQLTYTWTFSDGSTAAGSTVEHRFASPGSALATLSVTDPSGARGTAEVAVSVSSGSAPCGVLTRGVSKTSFKTFTLTRGIKAKFVLSPKSVNPGQKQSIQLVVVGKKRNLAKLKKKLKKVLGNVTVLSGTNRILTLKPGKWTSTVPVSKLKLGSNKLVFTFKPRKRGKRFRDQPARLTLTQTGIC